MQTFAPDSLTTALWATNLAAPLDGLDAWTAAVDARMAEARAEGADILVMPEYACVQWLSFAPAGLAASEEIPWMADRAAEAVEAAARLAGKHRMALLAGSIPWWPDTNEPDADRKPVNRAWLLLPDGRRYQQDKLCLTPSEKDPDAWELTTGNAIQLVTWRGMTLAVLICLDVELPAVSARLAPYRPDLLLVPSMTSGLSGHHRVNSCARARAVELQAAVLTVGYIGDAATGQPRDGNTGGAAVYLPSEPDLGETGVAGEQPPVAEVQGPGPMLLTRVPLGRIRTLRDGGGAEVWPGAWRADSLTILEDGETA